MIDTVNLRFVEYAQNFFVQCACRSLIAPKRFLDDDARPRLARFWPIQARFSELLDDFQINFGRRSQIKKPVAAELAFAVQFVQSFRQALERFWIVIITGKVMEMVQEVSPLLIAGAGSLRFR